MFIPFIENCFKHGISNQINEGFVNIVMNIDTEEIGISIENSKAPTRPTINGKKSGGIGLVNVKRRLNLLYPNKHYLQVNENPNTYKVELTMKMD